MSIPDLIREAAIDVSINSLPMPCLHALLDHSYRWDWLGENFNGQDFRTFALIVAEAIQ